jgi:hypothetical protein
MCCKFVKWITEIVTVKIQINRDQIQNPQLITVAETLTRDNIHAYLTTPLCGRNMSNLHESLDHVVIRQESVKLH